MIGRMHRPLMLSALALCLLQLTPAGALAGETYSWTPIVIPHVTVAGAFGLNDLGQVAISDATGTVSGIYQYGRFTRLPNPPAGFTVTATGINDAGVIAGFATTTANAHEQGFILNHGQYRFFSRPGWDTTEPRSIGPSGLIVGINVQDTGEYAGFVYDPSAGTFTDVTPSGSFYTIAQGINRFGRISGSGQDDSLGRYAFISQPNTLGTGATASVPFLERIRLADGKANARGINDEGVITGWALSNGQTVGFVGSESRGYQVLVPPGGDVAGNMAFCQGINNARQVSCVVEDANGNPLTGFIGTPMGDNQQ